MPVLMRRAIVVSLIVAIIAAAGAAAGYRYGKYRFEAPGPASNDVVVYLPPGTALRDIATILSKAQVIDCERLFVAATWFTGQARALKAGEYLIPAGASAAKVLDIIVSGKTWKRRLTVPEGLRSAAVVALVNRAEGLEGDITTIPSEGSLLPETYLYERGDRRSSVLAQMRDAMDAALTRLWANRDENLPLALPEEVVVLASIVEKETAISEERGRIAAVFLNRLRRGMPLQSDPTVAYALTNGARALGRELSRADLTVDHPYNTYANLGLPPGPIANPGLASLSAVIDPPETKELYFVADGTGGHAFAATLAEHNRNVARWRQIERQRNSR